MTNHLMFRIQAKWGKLNKQSLKNLKDDLSELVGLIQRIYKCSRSQAELEFHAFQLTLRPVLHPAVTKPPPSSRRE